MSNAKALSAAGLRDAAPLFAALGDPTRLRIVNQLAANGPSSISSLCDAAEVTRQAVTKHLHVLADSGLVHSERHGRECIWELRAARLHRAREYLERIDAQWDAALDRLRMFVED